MYPPPTPFKAKFSKSLMTFLPWSWIFCAFTCLLFFSQLFWAFIYDPSLLTVRQTCRVCSEEAGITTRPDLWALYQYANPYCFMNFKSVDIPFLIETFWFYFWYPAMKIVIYHLLACQSKSFCLAYLFSLTCWRNSLVPCVFYYVCGFERRYLNKHFLVNHKVLMTFIRKCWSNFPYVNLFLEVNLVSKGSSIKHLWLYLFILWFIQAQGVKIQTRN